jgi:hypothetical protein
MSIYDVAFDFKDVDIDKFREIIDAMGKKYGIAVGTAWRELGPQAYRYGRVRVTEVEGVFFSGSRTTGHANRVVSMRQVIMQASPLWGGSMATILGLDELQNLSTALDNAG